MKSNVLTTVILLMLASNVVNAQLKINEYGRIGIGIEPSPYHKVLVKGNLVLTTYPEVPAPLDRYTEFRIVVGNGLPGVEFGTPTGKIAVWSSEVGYNKLYASHIYMSSDSRLKANIAPLQNGLNTILALNPTSFNKLDTLGAIPSNKREYGLLAQEVVSVLPEIIDTAKDDIMLIDYQQIISFLIAAIQEQQVMIDSIIASSYNLKSSNSQNYTTTQIDVKLVSKKIVLDQNKPNPFKEQTTITYFIPDHVSDVMIIFTDIDGTVIKEVPIYDKGNGQLNVYASDLSSGIYTYSIVADGITLDTKKMVKCK